MELYYSGAGQDFLHEQLLAKMNSESALQKDRDRKFAREIGMTTFEFDENKREGKVSLNLTVDGKKTNLNFTGKLDNKMRLSTAKFFRKYNICKILRRRTVAAQ